MTDEPVRRVTRRKALGLIGAGSGLALAAACRGGAPETPAEEAPPATPATAPPAVTFPDGAVIRTVLDDIAPEALAGGATMFHEHLQFAFRM